MKNESVGDGRLVEDREGEWDRKMGTWDLGFGTILPLFLGANWGIFAVFLVKQFAASFNGPIWDCISF